MQKLLVKRIRTGNVYRLSAIGTAVGGIPVCTLFGILAFFDLMTLHWNGSPVSGPRALLVGPLMGFVFALLGTAIFGSAMALGLWLYSQFKPIELEYEQMPTEDAPVA